MSSDEVVVLIIAGVIVWKMWAPWYRTALAFYANSRSSGFELVELSSPIVALAALLLVLLTAASHDVRNDVVYLGFYSVLGLAWIALALGASTANGLDFRSDVIERRNPSALCAWLGALAGHTLAFAGANIGDGPGWWVVLYCATLANGTVLLAWAGYEALTAISENVTIERTVSSGIRLGGLLCASGLISGRSASGDWVDASAAFGVFVRNVWPVALLLAIATAFERTLGPPARSARDRPEIGTIVGGIFPALLLICIAVSWILHLGHW